MNIYMYINIKIKANIRKLAMATPCESLFPNIGHGDALLAPVSECMGLRPKSENLPWRRPVQADFLKLAMATLCQSLFTKAW